MSAVSVLALIGVLACAFVFAGNSLTAESRTVHARLRIRFWSYGLTSCPRVASGRRSLPASGTFLTPRPSARATQHHT
jgi:hypothetical protein